MRFRRDALALLFAAAAVSLALADWQVSVICYALDREVLAF